MKCSNQQKSSKRRAAQPQNLVCCGKREGKSGSQRKNGERLGPLDNQNLVETRPSNLGTQADVLLRQENVSPAARGRRMMASVVLQQYGVPRLPIPRYQSVQIRYIDSSYTSSKVQVLWSWLTANSISLADNRIKWPDH